MYIKYFVEYLIIQPFSLKEDTMFVSSSNQAFLIGNKL